MSDKSESIIYQTDDGLTKIDVRLDEDTVWLTQAEMVELFQYGLLRLRWLNYSSPASRI